MGFYKKGFMGKSTPKHNVYTNDKAQKLKDIERQQNEYARKQKAKEHEEKARHNNF